MARPRRNCMVQVPPRVKGFNPIGYYSDQLEPVLLNIEEYESIRLLDYESLSQGEAATIMEISRPTLTRIYLRARKKIAIALTEARQIKIEGGSGIFSSSWFECLNCECSFNKLQDKAVNECPLCSSEQMVIIGEDYQ